MMNNFGQFFSGSRVWQTSDNILLHSTSFFGNHCASYKIISVTPKRWLKTQIFGKAIFLVEKKLDLLFSRNMEYDKGHGTIYKGAHGILLNIVQFIRSFL